jgi:hypothetical protein
MNFLLQPDDAHWNSAAQCPLACGWERPIDVLPARALQLYRGFAVSADRMSLRRKGNSAVLVQGRGISVLFIHVFRLSMPFAKIIWPALAPPLNRAVTQATVRTHSRVKFVQRANSFAT